MDGTDKFKWLASTCANSDIRAASLCSAGQPRADVSRWFFSEAIRLLNRKRYLRFFQISPPVAELKLALLLSLLSVHTTDTGTEIPSAFGQEPCIGSAEAELNVVEVEGISRVTVHE